MLAVGARSIDPGWAFLLVAVATAVVVRHLLLWIVSRLLKSLYAPVLDPENSTDTRVAVGCVAMLISSPMLMLEGLVSALVLALLVGYWAPGAVQQFGGSGVHEPFLLRPDQFLVGTDLALERVFQGNGLPAVFCAVVLLEFAFGAWQIATGRYRDQELLGDLRERPRLWLVLAGVGLGVLGFLWTFAWLFRHSPAIVWCFLLHYRPLSGWVSKWRHRLQARPTDLDDHRD